MDKKVSLTVEANSILSYIKNNLFKKYPSSFITVEYFILGALEDIHCDAYVTLFQIVPVEKINKLANLYRNYLADAVPKLEANKQNTDRLDYDKFYDRCLIEASEKFGSTVSSSQMLATMMRLSATIGKQFASIGVTPERFLETMKRMKALKQQIIEINQPTIRMAANNVENFLTNLNGKAKSGNIDKVIGNDDVIEEIFETLGKRDKNNVVLVGESGSGKTATAMHIANIITDGKAPKMFSNKKLMRLDFLSLISGASLRGNFEAKYGAIVSDAAKNGGYIFFIDDVQSILSDKSKFSEINIEQVLDMILSERRIMVIATADDKSYSQYILSNPTLNRRFRKVRMPSKSREEVIEIVNSSKSKYERFHDVTYDESVITVAVDLAMRYIKDRSPIDTVFDVLDEAGSSARMNTKEDEEIKSVSDELDAVRKKLNEYKDKEENYSDYDELRSKEIELNTKLLVMKKDAALNKKSIEVSEDLIRQIMSRKVNVPVEKLTENEISSLKTLDERLKNNVIGQDEAIEKVCRAVKRQRIGINTSGKPPVLLFAGTTGTGKTFLAKRLAKEVFGDEKMMVRLDMSEYSDKTSVNKLYGSPSGYIGYDKGGVLTEAVKKNNHCVLLLDEIEKADDKVYDVFLQLFDEGRLTDNMGITVDFSNVIIIMTSNIGAKEASERGKPIGFIDNIDNSLEIFKSSLKNKFKPEFLNRIDSIVYFNKLTREQIKKIFLNEIRELDERLKKINCHLDGEFFADEYIEKLMEKTKGQENFGARPVKRIVEAEIEDKVVDFIIDKQPDNDFGIKIEDLQNA